MGKDILKKQSMMKRIVTFLSLIIISISVNLLAQRLVYPLNKAWRFHKGHASVVAPTAEWEEVTLPHSWNVKDGQESGKNRLDNNGHSLMQEEETVSVMDPILKFGYYRGTGWYAHSINVPTAWKEKRVFVRFEAAGQVARVYVNGQMQGEHRGAFTAFCYELTPYIQPGKQNELRVEVDNMHRQDIPPLSGDFNVNGGLYRPAQLIVTDKICVSPLDYASPGVYITTNKLNTDKAVIEVRSLISNGIRAAMSNEPEVPDATVMIETLVKDITGKVVATARTPEQIAAGITKEVIQILDIEKPHLWNGRKDPYLYQVEVNVLRNETMVDQVIQSLGLRTFQIDAVSGFLLNGKPYPIYEVGRHQDFKDKAWALTEYENELDYAIIKEMGATAIRFAHYPQSQNMHDIADREGFLVWDEIPLVNEIRLDHGAKQNVCEMMKEMVKQLYNHPSVAWWGIYNEIENIYTPPSEDFLTELRDGIRDIDSTCRIVVGASDHGLRAHNQIPEATCFNNYPGWYHGNYPKEEGYTGELAQLDKWITDRVREIDMRIAISEYGAGGDYKQHTEGNPQKPNPAHGGPFQPEEWLAYVHEENWRVMQNNENLWGTFLWAMFDFASCMRNEGSVPSLNTKGIVSQDRKVKKDPYYLYKANWNPEPMVYITSRRSIKRTQPVTDIKVYSNCIEVTLKVNEKTIGKMRPDAVKVCLFKDVELKEGKNKIEVVGRTAQSGDWPSDTCEWILES